MTDDERFAAINIIAANPEGGDIIPGLAGARKVRIPKEGKGKRGGYRVVTYYLDDDTPVYLLTVISKGQRSNLTEKQKKQVREAKDVKRENR